jgi:hypothetical protein
VLHLADALNDRQILSEELNQLRAVPAVAHQVKAARSSNLPVLGLPQLLSSISSRVSGSIDTNFRDELP